jgi:uncharacterized protein
MMSKTRLSALVTDWRWKEVRDGLASAPALLDYRDERGRSFLHLCCGVNAKDRGQRPADSIKTAEVLLAAGLGIDAAAFVEGNWRATPLWYAIARGRNLTLARFLLERGSTPEYCLWAAGYNDDVPAIRLLVEHGASLDPVAEGHTPFLSAVQNSHFRAADALATLGANVDYQDADGMTALHYMLKKSSAEEHFRMLLRHGARGDLPDRAGKTAAEMMARKRTPGFRRMAEELRSGESRRAVR